MSGGHTPPSITAAACNAKLAAGAIVLLDVRRQPVFADASDMLRGAQWRDPAAASEWGARMPSARPVVVYCVHGHEVSQNAARELRRIGIDASYLEDGFEGWRAAGLPLAKRALAEPGATYVTRARPKIDRIAVPWLIRRFVDPNAKFRYVPASEVLKVAAETAAIPFDVPHVEISHVGPLCSFDACIAKFRIKDTALDRVAQVVRGADTGALDLAPEAAGLLAFSLGLSAQFADDDAMLEAGMALYDALYAWARTAQGESHSWQPKSM